jgi:N-acetyl sugar amidotransferase
MDTTDPNIVFDMNGICNHCHRYDTLLSMRVYEKDESKIMLDKIVKTIKTKGSNKDYDCLIGVSGGVDSTYVAYLTKKLGLKPLAVHFDNGWNSELAVSNIEKVLDKLNIDLYTYVIDWPTFKDLQLSFLKSSTPDGEIPTDHAINALLFSEANKRNIKFIINGMNFATESMAVESWSYGHSDWKYIKSIHKKFGQSSLNKYPKYTFLDLFYWTFLKSIKVISILNYIDYKKEEVMNILQNELGWKYYGGKHYESVYTRFYQGFILPKKFNIDKRKGHLSDLIRSNQISREDALKELRNPIYDPVLLKQDQDFVLKKLNFTNEKFEEILRLPPKSFREYPNNYKKIKHLKNFVNLLRSKGYYSK